MEPSSIGLAVFVLLSVVGWGLGSAPLIGLMVSLPFGSTAFARLPALRGATPLIYTLFALALSANTFLRPDALAQLRAVFARHRSAWVVFSLMTLAIAVTILSPRLFAGATVALLPVDQVYTESPLQPSSQNITQGGYFLLGGLVYFAVSILLLEKPRRVLIIRAFFAFCITHTTCGLVDLVAKRAGQSDVFAPIRTARYAMRSKDVVAGFPRLTGALPEGSTFALMTLACLGFAYVYWRGTGSRLALWITVINFVLVILSTSTTAYVGFAILCLLPAVRILRSIRHGGLAAQDRQIVGLGFLAVVFSLVVLMTNDRTSSVVDLLNATVIAKSTSASGVERLHFNAVSMRNFLDTHGLGVGLGSSRASSWPIAVLAQLGLLGAIIMAAGVALVLRGMTGIAPTPENAELIVAGNSVCASAVGGLVAASISGGSADPGIAFFIALAVVTSWRGHARNMAAAQAG